MNQIKHLVFKEIREQIISSRGGILIIAASIILAVFSLLLVSNTELSLLDNAQAVYMMSGITLILTSLIAVVLGSDSFAGERGRKTLETLISAPISVRNIAVSKLIALILIYLLLFFVSVPFLWAVASTGQNLIPALEYVFSTGILLVMLYGALSVILSIKIKTYKAVLSINMVILLLTAAPFILSPSLRQSAVGRILDLLNPFACALNTLDSVIVDSQGIFYQAVRLTVIGFYVLLFSCVLFWISKRRIEL